VLIGDRNLCVLARRRRLAAEQARLTDRCHIGLAVVTVEKPAQ
jgi:hypothetical protein